MPKGSYSAKQRKLAMELLGRFSKWYGEDESRLSRYQRVQEIIDFSDEDYADWKKQ